VVRRDFVAVTLVPLANVDPSGMRWLRSAEDATLFTLLAGEDAVATVQWEKGNGAHANAAAAGATWTVRRVGLLTTQLTLRAGGASTDLAKMTLHVGVHRGENYHLVKFVDGATYRLHRAGVQTPAWTVTTEAGAEWIHIEPVRDGRRLVSGAVVVDGAARTSPDLLALLVLSWFFIVLVWFEDESLLPFEEVLSDLERR
jgi:hypothetical protein